MKVSICVPVYRVEKYIERCAHSLFEQTYNNIEYIFVDDYSPDKSIKILKNVLEKYPMRKPHVRIIRHDNNRGLAAARNTAVENCRTEFLMHVDSDDWIEKDTVERCVTKQQEENSDIVLFDFLMHHPKYIVEKKRPVGLSPYDLTVQFLNSKAFTSVWGAMIRTSLYKDNGITAHEGLNVGEDYYVMPRLSYYAHNISNVSEFLYHYDFTNTNSYMHTFNEKKAQIQKQVIEEQKEYFADKGQKYVDAICENEILMLVQQLIDCVKYSGSETFYHNTRIRIDRVSQKYKKILGFQYRLCLLIRNRFILRSYIKIAGTIKHICKK